MEKPNAATVTFYERAMPNDSRARKGQMFGHPCAYVNGNMFFGTFGQSVILRVGAERTASLATGALRMFEPMPARPWKEYLQVDAGAMPEADVAALAAEALEHTAALPPKAEKPKAEKKAKPAAKKPKKA